MSKSTTKAAPAAATNTARVAEPTVVATAPEAPSSKLQAPKEQVESSLEKSLAAIGIPMSQAPSSKLQAPKSPDLGSETKDDGPSLETQTPAVPEAGQEPSPAPEPAKENVDVDIEGTVIPAEAETTEDPDEPTLDESSSQWPESALHEVSKLRAQKRELKGKAAEAVSKLTELETRLSEAEAKLADESVGASERRSVGASGAEQLQDVKTLGELQRRTAEAEELLEWCDDQLIALRENPAAVEQALKVNKVVLTDREGAEDFSRDRMEGFILSTRRKVDTTLRKHVPARQRYLTVNAESESNAAKLFPWYKDKTSAEYQLSQQILRAHPEIQQWPDWKIAVGIQVRGLQEIRKQAAAKAGSPEVRGQKSEVRTATVIAPRIPGIPATAPARVDERAAALSSAQEKIRNPRNGEDVVGAISTLLAQAKR